MKKRIISCTLSAAMLFSTSFAVLPQTALADAYSAAQQLTTGTILFPNDIISFDENSKVIFSSLTEVSVNNKMYILPTYDELQSIKIRVDSRKFYGWKVTNETFDSTTGKRVALELTPVFISYDNAKSDLTVTFSSENTKTQPIIKLTPKSGYILDSVASGISYNKETNEITVQSPVIDEYGIISLGDTYKEEAPVITIYNKSTAVNQLKVCPPTTSNIQVDFDAKASFSSGIESTEGISWKLDDDLEFISIDNTGLVTVTPYFTGKDFTVTASIGEVSATAKVLLEHSYGEWTPFLPATLTSEGINIRECIICHTQETEKTEKLQDQGFPTGKITVNETDNWSDFVSAVDFASYAYKTANISITAEDDIEVKDVSYYISNTALTIEQIKAHTSWTSSKEASLSSDGKYIVYAKITDSSDNVSYISTNGFVIDNIAPVINGIENGQTYTEAKTFTITEENLSVVKINDIDAQSVSGVYTLPLAANPLYKVYVCDKAGNEITYTVNIIADSHADDNKIGGITEDATYRKGSSVSFTAKGYNMYLTTPSEGDIRYIPASYGVLASHSFTSSTYRQSISTSNLSVGEHTLTVTFKHQTYTASEGWKDTGITDTKSVNFNIIKKEEIETRNFRASFFIVKFDTNGGTKIDNVMINRSKYLTEPVAPTKVGYKFDGWYTNEACTKEYDFSERVSANMTLYAKWIKTSSDVDDNIFTDISKDDWYYDNIAYVYASGLMNGTGDAEFSPDMPTTRAMIVTILYRLEGEPATKTSSFYDVSPDSYYAKAVSWAQESNIVNGMTYTTFAPDTEISREQLMTILYRYAEYKDYDLSSRADLGNYTDADQISSYADNAFKWAIATKVASERTQKFIYPRASATRAEVAMAFQNFIEGNEQ